MKLINTLILIALSLSCLTSCRSNGRDVSEKDFWGVHTQDCNNEIQTFKVNPKEAFQLFSRFAEKELVAERIRLQNDGTIYYKKSKAEIIRSLKKRLPRYKLRMLFKKRYFFNIDKPSKQNIYKLEGYLVDPSTGEVTKYRGPRYLTLSEKEALGL